MASRAFTNAFLQLAANDISDFLESVNLNYSAEELDGTTMGDTTRERLGGLKDWSIDATVKPDAASTLDAILFPLVGTTIAIELRPDQGAVAPANPKFTGSALVVSYNPAAGSVGDVHTAPVRLVSAGALTRAEA